MTLREQLIQLKILGWTMDDLIGLVSELETVTKPISPNMETVRKSVFKNYELQHEKIQKGKMGKYVEQIVSEKFKKLGIPAHIKGYQYARESIIMCIEDPTLLNALIKMLYPQIARKYETTPERVESAIRHAIAVAWPRGDIKYIEEVFGVSTSERRKPTNSEFIAMMTDVIRMEIGDC